MFSEDKREKKGIKKGSRFKFYLDTKGEELASELPVQLLKEAAFQAGRRSGGFEKRKE